MTEIVLKPELLKGLQKVLVEYEPKNEDPILASQYLSAVVGSIVATAEIPKKDRDDILKQLIEFTQYVYDQQTDTLKQGETSSEKPSEDAYGKWTPE
jgi:cytochrome oxidase Cu insertion factor (SCO1/SenC/PrrC family)|tara:strand:- start:248 stop:538 length:291 start_codon:yes stop_codon:yes gene_type:complete